MKAENFIEEKLEKIEKIFKELDEEECKIIEGAINNFDNGKMSMEESAIFIRSEMAKIRQQLKADFEKVLKEVQVAIEESEFTDKEKETIISSVSACVSYQFSIREKDIKELKKEINKGE